MKEIWKYQLGPSAANTIVYIPYDYKILHVGVQNGIACIWVEIDPSHPTKAVEFEWVGTGYEVPVDKQYLGTVVIGDYVWHLYQ